MPDEAHLRDPLAGLRERLEATRVAAEKLAGEAAGAAGAAARGEEPPPGWSTQAERERVREDVAALADVLHTLGQIVPPELRAQLGEVLRQILLLLRALIDWIVDQIPQVRGYEPEVQDIPVS